MRRHFRWAVVVEQEIKVLIKSRFFLVTMLFALIHTLLRLLQVVAFDIVMQDPNNPLTAPLQQIRLIAVDEFMFFTFIRAQGTVAFILCLHAGSGMICNDVNNNLMEIYFSKPLSWRDYALGKVATLVLIGLTITALPATLLAVLHNLLAPGMDTLRASYWWPASIIAYSFIIVLPCALGVLACSAIMRSQNNASVTIFMVLAANSAMGGLLAALLHNRDFLVLSFPMALNRVGQALFRDTQLLFTLRWEWSMLFVVLVCAGSAWIIATRVRRAEIAP